MQKREKRERDENHDLHERVRSIENKLLGNSNSILERLTRLETNQEHIRELIEQYYHTSMSEREKIIEKTATVVQSKIEEISGLLQNQVNAQFRSNKYQIIGMWIALVVAVISIIASRTILRF